MNPGSREAGPNFEFPPEPEGLERQRERSMEERPAEEASVGKHKTPSSDLVVQAPAVPAKTDDHGQSTPAAQQATPTTGLAAQDVDLIEKQWVESAKTIVNQTKDDPYTQKKRMNKVKADYIKKRFN